MSNLEALVRALIAATLITAMGIMMDHTDARIKREEKGEKEDET